MKLLDLLNESVETGLDVKTTSDGNIIINNRFKYKLQVDLGIFGWGDVTVEKVVPVGETYKITASKLGKTVTEIVPVDSVKMIQNNLGKDKIELGGGTPKRIKKIS